LITFEDIATITQDVPDKWEIIPNILTVVTCFKNCLSAPLLKKWSWQWWIWIWLLQIANRKW